jgi:hypothetical protein
MSNDNGDKPAMPTKHDSEHFEHSHHYSTGLTKREHFALHIYAGMISACDAEGQWTGVDSADEAVREADLLLAALENKS